MDRVYSLNSEACAVHWVCGLYSALRQDLSTGCNGRRSDGQSARVCVRSMRRTGCRLIDGGQWHADTHRFIYSRRTRQSVVIRSVVGIVSPSSAHRLRVDSCLSRDMRPTYDVSLVLRPRRPAAPWPNPVTNQSDAASGRVVALIPVNPYRNHLGRRRRRRRRRQRDRISVTLSCVSEPSRTARTPPCTALIVVPSCGGACWFRHRMMERRGRPRRTDKSHLRVDECSRATLHRSASSNGSSSSSGTSRSLFSDVVADSRLRCSQNKTITTVLAAAAAVSLSLFAAAVCAALLRSIWCMVAVWSWSWNVSAFLLG